MQEISIQQVLSEINEGASEGRVFVICFVRATGKERGSIKTVTKAIKGGPTREVTPPKYSRSLHKDQYTLPVTDLETGEYLSPIISHIIQYNQFKVRH